MSKRYRLLTCSAVPLAVLVWSAEAHAQEQQPAGNEFQEIVVTAQKRSERLTDVPMSITAASGEQLAERGVASVADLTKVVPGLTFQPSDYGSPVYTIRGVGLKDIAVAVPPTVSVYVDQVPLPFSAMTLGAALDLERVEVLKGPQGTLFGQNSTGGAINYIAAKPTDAFEAGAEFTYGRFNQIDAQGFVSGPLSSTLRARVAARTEQRDAWQKSQTRDDELGRRNFTTGRLLLDWDASETLRLQFNLNGWMNKSESQAAQFVRYAPAVPPAFGGLATLVPAIQAYSPAPSKARIADWDPNVDFESDDDLIQGSVRADWELSDLVTVTSITAYSRFKQDAPIDPDGVNVDDFRMTLNSDIKSFSQELRAAGQTPSNKVRWMIGGNYQNDVTRDDQHGHTRGTSTGVLGLTSTDFFNSNHQEITTAAAFASLDYQLTDTVTLQGSARYTESTNDFDGCVRDFGDGVMAGAFSFFSTTPIAPGGCVTIDPNSFAAGLVRNRLREDNLSWRVSLNFKPSPDYLLYANVTKGYKAGTFPTVPGTIANQLDPVPQESVLAYEAGFKAALLDRSLQLSGAGFYYDYKDKQLIGFIPTIFGPNPGQISVPKSRVIGAELSLTWTPVEGLTLTGGGTYVDSKVRGSFPSYDPFAQVVDLGGEVFPNTPKWQLAADVDYEYELAPGTVVHFGAGYSYRSRSVASFGGNPEFELPAYGLLDLRAGVDIDRWRIQLWGHNVTDKFYLTSVSHVVDTIARVSGMPATYGVTVGYRY